MVHDHNCQSCGAQWLCGNEACPEDDTCPDCGHRWDEQDEKVREEEGITRAEEEIAPVGPPDAA